VPLEIWNRHPERRISVFPINRPVSSISASIGTFHPCDRRDTRFEYFPDRIRRRLRTPEEYGRHPTGSGDSPTSIPNRTASFFDWNREHVSVGETLPRNRCGTWRSNPDHAQKPAREDSPGPSAASIHAHTSRCRMYAAALELPVRTSGIALAHSALSEVRRGPRARPAWFAACSSQSSLREERMPCADLRTAYPIDQSVRPQR